MDFKEKMQILKNKAQEFKVQVNEAVENTYPKDFKFIKTILNNSITEGIDAPLSQIKQVEERLNFIQEQCKILQTIVEKQYQIVKEKWKQYIEIAIEQYSQYEKQLKNEFCCQFSYYNYIVNQRLLWVQNQYYENILFPQKTIKDFQDHCQNTLTQLLNKDIQGQQKFNFRTFNREAQKAFDYADKKFQDLKKKYAKQAQGDLTQIQETISIRLYKGWQQGMADKQIDEIINIKDLEYQIQWGKELILLKQQSEALKTEVKEVVQQKYLKDFEFIRNQLIDKIINDIEIVQTENTHPSEKFNQIQQLQTNLQQIVQTQYRIIKSIQKNNIDIVIQTYKEKKQNILSQIFLEFVFYKKIVDQQLNQIEREYVLRVNPIQLEADQIKKHCQSVFDALFYGPIQSPNSMNFEIFKDYSQNAYQYVIGKFDSLKQRLAENRSIKWEEEENKALTKLYQGWQQGMDNNQIDELIDLKSYEKLIPQRKEVFVPEQTPEIVKAIPEELKKQVQEFISATYSQDFKFIRMQLISKIQQEMQQAPDFLNQLQNNMQQTVQALYQIICQYLRNFIDAALEIYNFNKNQIMQQPCYWFAHYSAVNQRLAWSYAQYIEKVQLTPQPDQFKSQCQEVFNKLFYQLIEGQPKIDFQEFNNNVSQALSYVSNKYSQLQQKIQQQYQNEANLVNWAQIKIQVFAKLYQGWKPRMDNHEIDELLKFDLKKQEEQIQLEIYLIQTVNAFIQLGPKNGHFYLFDEEYQMINQNAKIQEVLRQTSTLDQFVSQFYQDIIATLVHDEQVERLKKALIEGIIALDLIPKKFPLNDFFKGQVTQMYFNQIRNLAFQNFGKCSFWHFKNQYPQDNDLINLLLGSLPRDPEQIQLLIQPIQDKYNSIKADIRHKFKNLIYSEEEYQQVIDESDPKFLEIVHPYNSSCLDKDQEQYLLQNIDKFQKVYFLQWLNKTWDLCKEELKKYQEIQEEQLIKEFNRLKDEIEQSIQNQIHQLNQGELLVDQFKNRWSEWSEQIIESFVEIYKE